MQKKESTEDEAENRGERRDHIIGNRGSREEGEEILRLKDADGEYQGQVQDQPVTYVLCGEFLEDFKHRKRGEETG